MRFDLIGLLRFENHKIIRKVTTLSKAIIPTQYSVRLDAADPLHRLGVHQAENNRFNDNRPRQRFGQVRKQRGQYQEREEDQHPPGQHLLVDVGLVVVFESVLPRCCKSL